MAIKCDYIMSDQLSQDVYLRVDPKFHLFIKRNGWRVFEDSLSESYLDIGDLLQADFKKFEFSEGVDYKGIPTGKEYIDKDGEIISYLPVNSDDCPDRLKYSIDKNNILISSVSKAVTPALCYNDKDDLEDYVFSNGFYVLKARKGYENKFLLYLLRLNEVKEILDNCIYRGIGIPTYKLEDLLRLKIPAFDIDKQKKAIELISPLEKSIQKLKTEIRSTDDIINSVFVREFDWKISDFNEIKKEKKYLCDFKDFAANYDLRFSAKFHRPSGGFVYNEIKKEKWCRIKELISEPITLGASISPDDFDSSGDTYYISMATVKNFQVEIDDTQLVSDEYASLKKNKSKYVGNGDVIMTRSGAAIGKFALVNDDIQAIHSDFTMRIRLKNVEKRFAYYYFRSIYFQYLIEINYKGLQNNNIFPNQIQEFPVPQISKEQQLAIVCELDEKLKKQTEIKEKIYDLRKKMGDIVKTTLLNK